MADVKGPLRKLAEMAWSIHAPVCGSRSHEDMGAGVQNWAGLTRLHLTRLI